MAVLLLNAATAPAQLEDNAVYLDDSPRAWDLFQRASDHAAENPGEAARLYQELLDQYAMRLIPRSPADRDHFVAVRGRVHRALLEQPAVLERYRMIESPRAVRLLESGELETLHRTRFLTASALEATLRLAQDAFEHARFRAALQLLIDAGNHPDLHGRRAAYRWLLLGLASHYLDEHELFAEANAALERDDSPHARAARTELQRITAEVDPPHSARGLSIFEAAPPIAYESIVETPIWRIPLEDTLFRRRFSSDQRSVAGGSNAEQSARITGEWLTVAPTVADRAIYINEGQVIRAFDRFSVRELWRKQIGDRGLINVGGGRTVGDLNGVAIDGDLLVTVTGHGSGGSRIGSARIVCLNRTTGETMWEVGLSRLLPGEEYDGLFPLGVPVIADGMVYLTARRTARLVLTSTFVIALDLHSNDNDQRLRWVRFIASSANMQGSETRPFCHLKVENGRVYAATSVGAVACMDGASGEMQWLRRLQSPLRPSMSSAAWEMVAPALTERSVITLSPDLQQIVVLHKEGGGEFMRFAAGRWGAPNYLLSHGDMVYAIGRDIVGAHVDELDAPLWRLSDHAARENRYDIRGRVQVAGDSLVIPTQVGIVVVDGRSGETLRILTNERDAGNPLAFGPELFVATSDRLTAYMPIATAETMLREQIAAAPLNPGPALSLLRLAAGAEGSTHAARLALDASSAVMSVLERIERSAIAPAAQRELFDLLIEVAARSSEEIEFSLAAELHGRIGAAASNVEQRIEHLIARGDWLRSAAARGDAAHLAAAVESYQSILSDPILADSPRYTRGVARPAGDVARERLREAIDRFGRSAYAALDAEAARMLEARRDTTDTGELLELARQYPFAPAAGEALELAARRLHADGRHRAALDAWQQRWSISVDRARQPEIIGGIVDLALDAGWERIARAWIEHAAEQRFDTIIVGGERVERDRVLAGLSPHVLPPPLPALGLPDVAEDETLIGLEGQLIPLHETLELWPAEFALLIHRNVLLRHNVPPLEESPLRGESSPWRGEPAWRSPLRDSNVELLAHGNGRVVLRYPDHNTVSVVDSSSGEEKWLHARLGTVLTDQRPGDQPRMNLPRIEIRGERRTVPLYEVLTFADSDTLIAVSRAAGMGRFSLSGRPERPMWLSDHRLDEVHHAALHDVALMLAGRGADASGSVHSGHILLIDPATGREFARLETPHREPVRWIRITDDGQAVYSTDFAVEAIDLVSGRRLWTNASEEVEWAERAWVFGPWIMIADRGARITALTRHDGRVHKPDAPRTGGASMAPAPFQVPSDVLWEPRDLRDMKVVRRGDDPLNDRLMAQFAERIVWFDRSGRVTGEDKVAHNRQYVNVIVGEDVISVISHVARGRSGMRRGSQRYVYRVYTMSHNSMLLDDDIEAVAIPTDHEAPAAAAGVNGYLLLSESGQTLIIPSGRAPK